MLRSIGVRVVFCLVVLICIFALGPSWAAETTEEKKSESKSQDQRQAQKDRAILEKITVTATRTEVDPELSPVDAYSVDREDIESQPDYYMNNFGEYIRDLPGVSVNQYYPWGPPWVHLRGTGHFLQRTVYLVDGVPLHAFLSTAISVNDIERVDVVLGPSSALYGANAAGGAVNIITRKGKLGEGAQAKASYGQNNTFRSHAEVSNQEGDFNYFFSYSGDISDGYQMKPIDGMVDLYKRGKTQYVKQASVEDNNYEYYWFAGKVGWDNKKGSSLTMAVNYQNRYLYGGQPNYIINDHGNTVVSSLRYEQELGDWGRLSATTGYQYQSIPDQENVGAKYVNGRVVVDGTVANHSEWDRTRIPLEVQSDFYLGKHNVLTVGVSAAQEKETDDTYKGTSSLQTYRYKLTTDMFAFYLQDQAFFFDDRLSVLAGIRYDYWRYHDIYDSGSSNPEPDDVTKDHVTYRGGVKFKVNDTLSIRSNAGTAYWPGNPKWFFQNLNTGSTWREANPDLKPEETWMVDFGGDITLRQWGTLIKATAYYGEIKNIMAYTYEVHPTEPDTTLIKSRNIGKAEIYGLELYLQQPLTKHLFFTGSLTLNHSRITEDQTNPDNVGNQLRNSPDYFGSLGLRYLHPEWINGEIVFRFSDDSYYDDNNEDLPYFHMDSYQTLDAKVWRDWKLGQDWVLNTSLSAVNIFDDQYATEIVYVNPGRYVEFMVGLRYLF